jgi:hypothetical protein
MKTANDMIMRVVALAKVRQRATHQDWLRATTSEHCRPSGATTTTCRALQGLWQRHGDPHDQECKGLRDGVSLHNVGTDKRPSWWHKK